ncbi:MAG: hypothetical protein M1832_001266 [Thelocarpon impressellum]|nr:MAG: hypothetical protein M1832_001266 [Thelocarpon impressellum]
MAAKQSHKVLTMAESDLIVQAFKNMESMPDINFENVATAGGLKDAWTASSKFNSLMSKLVVLSSTPVKAARARATPKAAKGAGVKKPRAAPRKAAATNFKPAAARGVTGKKLKSDGAVRDVVPDREGVQEGPIIISDDVEEILPAGKGKSPTSDLTPVHGTEDAIQKAGADTEKAGDKLGEHASRTKVEVRPQPMGRVVAAEVQGAAVAEGTADISVGGAIMTPTDVPAKDTNGVSHPET